MSIDKNTILTTIFTIIDDVLQLPKIEEALKRPQSQQKMSDSEVIAMAIYQELIGESREDHFYRLHGNELLKYFPNLIERSRYNRRKRDLWSVILGVRVSILLMLRAHEEEVVSIDSAPIPAMSYKRDKKKTDFTDAGYGVCSSKAMKYFGYKFHEMVSLTGVIVEFMLSSASPHDSQAVEEMVMGHESIFRLIIGDKAYNAPDVQDFLQEQLGIGLVAPLRENQKRAKKKKMKGLNRLRLIVETVNAQLQEQFHLSKHYAKSRWGLMTRVACKVTAHTLAIFINLLLGRPKLAIASLAV